MSKVGRKKRIKWREMIFQLHRKDISEAYTLFKLKHPDMSRNRCAYYVLKTFYSTTIMRTWKDFIEVYNQSYEDAVNFSVIKVKWC